MQGVEPVEELTSEQVEALAGGRTLRQQALHQAPPGRINEKMSGRLADALMQARAKFASNRPLMHGEHRAALCSASLSGGVATQAWWCPLERSSQTRLLA